MIFVFLLSACKEEKSNNIEIINDNADLNSEADSWKITQYGGDESKVMMFYTIEDNEGNLVIIDGGWDDNADAVREVIAAHNNHVVAWIITHPHPDHAMAFNEIIKNPGKITVDNIYTIAVNYDIYKEAANSHDRFDVFEDFLSITKDLNNVTYLKENDELDLIGLHMKVLHVWDEDTEAVGKSVLNNGSMMFTLEGNEEKMLFCADVENETEQFVIDRHLDDIKDVDYVQLGHHGNWGMTTAFYEHLSPKAVFFDAPSWLIEKEDGSYDAWMLKDYFEGRQIEMYIFNSEPNKITLY